MPKLTRGWTLALALIAVGAWAAWQLASGNEAAPEPGTAAARTESRKGKDQVTAEKVPVVVSRLAEPGTGEVFARERNLFEFAQSPEELEAIEAQRRATAEAQRVATQRAAEAAAAKAEADRKAAEVAAAAREAQAKALREQLALNPPKPTPPSFPYLYVGTIGPVDNPFAILSAPDRTYRYVRAGEAIDRDFKLEYIAQRRLDLSYTDKQFQDQFTQVQRTTDASASRAR
jgi:hypothetical protein